MNEDSQEKSKISDEGKFENIDNRNNSKKYRSVTGRDSDQSVSKIRNPIEQAPRERKRWVRPPGVGQATNENPGIIPDVTLPESDRTAHSNNETQIQSNDDLPQNEDDLIELDKDAENVEFKSDINSSFYFAPTSMICTNNKNTEVTNEVKKDDKFAKIQDIYKKFISTKSFVFSLPAEIQNAHCQNQEGNTTGNEASTNVRAPSPASVSSVTSSRRLEWDSGADVGYQTYHSEGYNTVGDNLSTIERIALVGGCSARLRMEPEGIAGSLQNLPTLPSSIPSSVPHISTSNGNIFKTPLAASTPLESERVKSSTGTDSESDIMPIVKMPRDLYLFPSRQEFDKHPSSEDDVNTQHNQSLNNAEENFISKKLSSSLTDLNDCCHCEDHKNTNSLPRSQSHLSLLLGENKQIQPFNAVNNSFALRYQQKRNNALNPCSASSSSIATVVPKHESPRVLDKLTQTSVPNPPDRNSVAVQVFESRNVSECEEKNTGSGSIEEHSDSDVINETVNNSDNARYYSQKFYDFSSKSYKGRHKNDLCKGVHKRTSAKKHKQSCNTEVEANNAVLSSAPTEDSKNTTHSSDNKSVSNSKSDFQLENEVVEKYSGTLDSIPSSTQTAASWTGGDVLHGNQMHGRRDSSGVVGSANSFEYLPGHVYESNAVTVNQNLHKNTIPEDSTSQSASSHLSLESRLIKNGSFWDDTASSTLKKDLEKGISLLKGLLDSKSYSARSKKKLVKMLVNRLVVSDYAEDGEMLQDKAAVSASWSYSKQDTSSLGFVNGSGLRLEESALVNEERQKIIEREEISGESAGEQQLKNKPQQKALPEAGKCVGTVSSERSGFSSSSDKVYHSDMYSESRVEETSTTGGQDGSSLTNTLSSKKSCSWKDYTTQSEREYEQHRSRNVNNKSLLLKLCDSERENQLSWISTEIRHLNNLKQLLEKQQRLTQSLDRHEMQNRGKQKMKKKPICHQKDNKTTYNDHSSAQSESRCQSSISSRVETSPLPEDSIHDHLTQQKHIKSPKKQHKRREIEKSPTKKDTNITKSISTQMPSSVNINNRNKNEINTKIRHGNVPTPDTDSVSYPLTFEVTAGALSDGTAGRINVYGQTVEGNTRKPRETSRKSVHTNNKNPEKHSDGDTSSKSSQSDTKQNALCCCECKTLLDKVVSGIKHNSSRGKIATENYSRLKIRHGVMKNCDCKSSNNCTLSSSGTLRDTPELNHDSEESHILPVTIGKIFTETKKSTRLQKENSTEKQVGTKGKCPCCGMEEGIYQQGDGDWKCDRCTKLGSISTVRRCHICGILESEQNDILDYDLNWKCSKCLQKELQSLEKCVHCGKKQQDASNNKEVESQSNSSSASSSKKTAPTSLGYILTLDTTTRSNSSTLNDTKIPLQEIRIKVPRKSRLSVSAKDKTKEKITKNIEKPRPRTTDSKENKKPEIINKSRRNQKDIMNKVEGRNYTLQEYLAANRPDFIRSAEFRRQCIDEIAYLRELRQNSKHKLLAIASQPNSEGNPSLKEAVPPPPLTIRRVFTQRSLRAQTERKYHNLPEIVSKKAEKKRKEDYRTNRLMAEVFAKKLQRKALKGEVNLSNSTSVITMI